MIVVILAAGYGKRMSDLTENTPKPLLKKDGKNLLDYKLEALPEETSEIVIVVGYRGEEIIQRYGYAYNKDIDDRTYGISSIPITYVWQKEMLGTAHALWEAKDILKEGAENDLDEDPELNLNSFMVLMGDDIYDERDLHELAKHRFAVLVQRPTHPTPGGRCEIDTDSKLVSITDEKEVTSNDFIYTGACILPLSIFNEEMVQIPGRTEYGLPQTFMQRAGKEKIEIVYSEKWKSVTNPEDLK